MSMKIKTFEDARIHTLKKWRRIYIKLKRLGEDDKCGFCFYSTNEAMKFLNENADRERCFYCPVETKCREIQEYNKGLISVYFDRVEELIYWLRKLEERDCKSSHQIEKEGGE